MIYLSCIRNHSLEVKHHYNQHLKKDSASTEPSKSHHQPSTLMTDKSTSSLLAVKPENRRSSFNIFERFRISKQDKIQANVQQKIRAVRAAEALDRQTNRRGKFRFTKQDVQIFRLTFR